MELVHYLLSIRPANACGLIHPNPVTGELYVDIRKQWNRFVAIGSRMLGYELTRKKADFFNFRDTGASHVADRAGDASHLLSVVKMMRDTSIATVKRHYFNIADDMMLEEIVDGWGRAGAGTFTPDRFRAS